MKTIKICEPFVWTTVDNERKRIPSDLYNEFVRDYEVGDLWQHGVAAPGCGMISYRITEINETGVYGYIVTDTSRTLEAWEVK